MKKILYIILIFGLGHFHLSEAWSIYSSGFSIFGNAENVILVEGDNITVNGKVLGNQNFTWRGQSIIWQHSSNYITNRSTIDLSDSFGPYSLEHIRGNVFIKEGVPPRLEIEKRLTAESLKDVETEVITGKNGTTITTILKNNSISGDGVDYMLYVPATSTISKVSTLLGAISVTFRGFLQHAITRNGAIMIDGCSALSGDLVNLSSEYGSIVANNVQGNMAADNRHGTIQIIDVSGDAFIKTKNGTIDLKNIKGSVKAKISNGHIIANNIGHLALAKSSNGNIELSNISKLGLYKASNGKVFLDGQKIKKQKDF